MRQRPGYHRLSLRSPHSEGTDSQQIHPPLTCQLQALGSWTPGTDEGLEVAVTVNVQPQWPAQWPKEAVTVVLNLHFHNNVEHFFTCLFTIL